MKVRRRQPQRHRRYSGGHVSHTGQIFFSDPVSDHVYRLAPYTNAGHERTSHSADRVFTAEHGSRSLLELERRGGSLEAKGFLGTITFGVDPTATPSGV